jgi:hypothetical protein
MKDLAYQGVIPKSPRFFRGPRDIPLHTSVKEGDPLLRLKNGYAQDDAIAEKMPPEI